MVGTIGGRTAVANNDQIVQGVSDGVAAANAEQNALLREQNRLIRQAIAQGREVVISPSVEFGRVNAKSKSMYDAARGTL